jgi:tetratricopeptide (TPR) repeat protein
VGLSELLEFPDPTVTSLCKAVCELPESARNLWNSASARTFDIRIEAAVCSLYWFAMAIYMFLANIYRQLGQSDKAAVMLDRCLDIAKARVVIKENSDPSRMNLANVHGARALLDEELSRNMKVALSENQEGLRIWEDVDNHPNTHPNAFPLDKKIVRAGVAELTTRVAVDYYRLGNIEAARDGFQKAYDLRQELVSAFPNDPQLKQDLSYSHGIARQGRGHCAAISQGSEG